MSSYRNQVAPPNPVIETPKNTEGRGRTAVRIKEETPRRTRPCFLKLKGNTKGTHLSRPSGQPVDPTTLVDKVNDLHPIIFDSHTPYAPSGIDAHGPPLSLPPCHSLALLTRKICTTFVDPEGLSPLLACRLIALNKNPGVRPIGICETVRRIAILTVTYSQSQVRRCSTLCRLLHSHLKSMLAMHSTL